MNWSSCVFVLKLNSCNNKTRNTTALTRQSRDTIGRRKLVVKRVHKKAIIADIWKRGSKMKMLLLLLLQLYFLDLRFRFSVFSFCFVLFFFFFFVRFVLIILVFSCFAIIVDYI